MTGPVPPAGEPPGRHDLVVGLGLEMAGDDGVGPAVLARLRADGDAGAHLLVLAEPVALLHRLEGVGHLVVVDALRSADQPGSVQVRRRRRRRARARPLQQPRARAGRGAAARGGSVRPTVSLLGRRRHRSPLRAGLGHVGGGGSGDRSRGRAGQGPPGLVRPDRRDRIPHLFQQLLISIPRGRSVAPMRAMMLKEFRELRRDHRTVGMLVMMPLLLLVVFG